MKGKFKGKILNLRNIIVSLIIVVIAAVSGISIVQYNSKNLQTNLGEAINEVSISDNTANKTIISKAVELYNEGNGYESGCSHFVDAVLKEAGLLKNTDTPNTYNWYNNTGITINGDYTLQTIAENANFSQSDWTTALGNASLMPGDIICGEATEKDKYGNVTHVGGHMIIFLGYASPNIAALNTHLGTNFYTNRPVGGITSGYWYVYVESEKDSKGTVYHPKLNAYSKIFKSNETHPEKNCNKIKVYRFVKNTTPPPPPPKEGRYHLGIKKFERNMDSNPTTLDSMYKVNCYQKTKDGKETLKDTQYPSSNANFARVKGMISDREETIDGENYIKIDENNEYDKYEIWEHAKPKGYINDLEYITLKMTFANSDSRRVIQFVYADYKNVHIQINASTSQGHTYYINDDGYYSESQGKYYDTITRKWYIKPLHKYEYKFLLQCNEGTVNLYLTNPENAGSYSLNFMKKSSGSSTSGDVTSDALEGAEFNVELYKDIKYGTNDFLFGSNITAYHNISSAERKGNRRF